MFLRRLSQYLGLSSDRKVAGDLTNRTPQWITGGLERFFFSVAVAVNMSGVLPAMIAWLAVKLAANWQYREEVQNPAEKANYKFSALIAGFLSMSIAFVSGLLIRVFSCS
jgi:hypothetical protein